MLGASCAVDVPYYVLEDISLFTGIDMCAMITTGSDSKLQGCMEDQVRKAMEADRDLTSPVVYDEENGLTKIDILARVAHREPYIQDIITSVDNGEGLTKYCTEYMTVITTTGHVVMVTTPTDMPVDGSSMCCYKLTVKPTGMLATNRRRFIRQVEDAGCKVVIIQANNGFSSVLA